MNWIEEFKKGSGIHIKKANRGKFTDYCGGKVTEECIQQGKHSPNPTIRKRATFAANARKWKHQEGGILLTNIPEKSKFYDSVSAEDVMPSTSNKKWIIPKLNNSNTTQAPTIITKDNNNSNDWSDIYKIIRATRFNRSSVNTNDISDDLKTLINMFNNAGIRIRVTSGYREGAKTKQGRVSNHASGNAIDIVPEDGDFAALANAIRTNSQIRSFMREKGLGVIDETTPEMLAITGGTGAHYHIGPDTLG